MKNIRTIEDLLTISIVWLKDLNKPQWSAMVLDEICELEMNDFPDEPLYTLKWRGQRLDIDDAPANWTFPD